MKIPNLRIRYYFLILITSVCLSSFAQTQPFPANKVYSYGLMPTNRNFQDAAANYNIWKTNFLESCGNGRYRVKFDNPNQTVSEGIAYGMLLTAYAGERTIFDGLWNYYKDNRNAQGLMNWKINGCNGGPAGTGGATDSEVDAAMALIVADFQWGSSSGINYSNDAKSLISAIKTHEVESGSYILKPGQFGGSSITNPSYFAPAYFKKFATFTNDSFWNTVANKCYEVINNNLSVNNAAGGLVSDWCTGSGNYSSDASGYANGGTKYSYDAARTPWRIAVDYAWYGDTQAKTYSKKSSDFIRITKNGSQNIVDGYNQNGSNFGQYHNSTFVGAFASAAIAGENQTHLNNSYTDLIGINEPYSYYNQTLKTIYLFFLSGNFYLPDGNTPPPPSNNLVSGAIYKIIGKQSGKSVDVMDVSNANGANIQQWSYGGGDNQKWRAELVSTGIWKLISIYSGKCLEVGAYSNTDGGNIQQWDYVNHSYQHWNITDTGDGSFKVINVGSNKAMDGAGTSDGANIQQWSYGDGNNQKWFFERVDGGVNRETNITILEENNFQKVFPNPTTGLVSIEANTETKIQIFDLLGKNVHEEKSTSNSITTIDLNHLKTGIYIIKSTYKETSTTQKLIIER
ncbi:putative secreted protein (Por secretion system target) [Flavobacterium sp. 9AF]|uniref:glycosyl hydrolase family 8 n=1 Tax=Flavobacterium sp. 9AF TaxID=2653142 RepID=UPI0012F23321|nr:glycosyl hydrolase family 8 [Flavobacterium sp. 9AF]VXC24563.1 putative secreted protein (Por secretion system target) [Flavobacterium sp. 9AF]